MASSPNQKTIKINKEECSRANIYAAINLEALQYAMIDLKGETFKLWLYLSKNQDGYTFALSPVDAIKWGVGSQSSYKRAVKELTAKGYLVETSSNHFDFNELPKVEETIVTIRKAS